MVDIPREIIKTILESSINDDGDVEGFMAARARYQWLLIYAVVGNHQWTSVAQELLFRQITILDDESNKKLGQAFQASPHLREYCRTTSAIMIESEKVVTNPSELDWIEGCQNIESLVLTNYAVDFNLLSRLSDIISSIGANIL
jgi:hypothetical protein